MLGWIKKMGTGTAAGDSAGEPAARGLGQRDVQPGHKDVPSTSRSGQRRGSSFLDAVGAMGRVSRKKDEKNNAASAVEQLDAQRAEKISCVAFKLVREIQRILKEARETQAAGGGGSSSGSVSVRTPAPTPPPPRHHKRSLVGAASGATSSTAADMTTATESLPSSATGKNDSSSARKRWAGTEELLTLLNGGSLGGAGEAEDRVKRYESVAEVQAKMEDLVEQALVPESHGDLCGILLEASTGEGHHPAFVKLCVDAGLPSNLVHCLRIMRVVEFESAMHDDSNERVVKVVRGEEVDTDDAMKETDYNSSADMVVTESPLTERATERIGQLLVTLCRDKSAGVGEQIKPHLPGLLSLAVSAYPPNGAHVQERARLVVEALMGGCLNASMVWLLHYQKAMLDVVGELRHLCGLDEAPSKSPTTVSRKGVRNYGSRTLSPLPKGPGDSRKRHSGSSGGGGSGGGDGGIGSAEPTSTELLGKDAEERGMWLTALRATVCTVRCASRFVPAFVQDFESAGGYETIGYMVRRSTIERLPPMLEQVCLLVSALSSSGMDALALAGGGGGGSGGGGPGSGGALGGGGERSEFAASNPSAFSIIQSLLAECTPPVEAVCLQGIVGRVSSGTCEVNCLAGGVQGLVEHGLDPEEAVVMVSERAVAMRLDRWGREHGANEPPLDSSTQEAGSESTVPHISAEASAFEFSEEDGGGSDHESRGASGTPGLASGRLHLGVGETAADVAEADEFRLRLLEALLGLYSNHPFNYGQLEARFHALSLFLCALPYYESSELKSLALKTLEVICVSFKDVHPRDALHSTSTAFTVCLDHMMGLLSDPLCSPAGIRSRVSIMQSASVRLLLDEVDGPGRGGRGGSGTCNIPDGAVGVDDVNEEEEEEEKKMSASLEKALVLLEDADMMRRMLEKLLEFDEKKYTAMFQATGILDQVLQPLLKRVLTLNVGGCPGAAHIWRAMRHPGMMSGHGFNVVGWPPGSGSIGSIRETGALALVSRATRLLCGTLALLLGYSPAICRQFRALRMHDTLYDIIRDFGPPSTEAALLALEKASASEPSGVPEDMAFLIELVQGSKSRAERWRQAAALMGLRSILLCKHQAVKDVWRESCGFEAALAAISSLDAAFSPARIIPIHNADNSQWLEDDHHVSIPTPSATAAGVVIVGAVSAGERATDDGTCEADGDTVNPAGSMSKWSCMPPEEACLMEAEHFRVIQAALFTLVASASAGPVGIIRGEQLVGCRANRRYLRREIGYDSLTCCLVNSGVVASPRYAGPAVKLLFTMVTELPCESMRFEADPDLEDVGDGLGAGHGCLGAGKAAGTGTWSGVRRGSGTGSGSVGSITGGSGGVGGACAGVDGEEGGVATIRNADAVMVILGVLPYISEDIAWAALGALNEVVRAGGFAEAEALMRAGAARKAADVLAKALHAQRACIRRKTVTTTATVIDLDGPDGGKGEARGSETIDIPGTSSVTVLTPTPASERPRSASRVVSPATGGRAGGGGDGGGALEANQRVVSPTRSHGASGASKSTKVLSASTSFRDRMSERGTVAVLSAPLHLTDRLQRRLVEFMVLVASRHVTNTDLAPLIRSVTLPLVMDSRGFVAPPTVWPAGLAMPPRAAFGCGLRNAKMAVGESALWIPGWGTYWSSEATCNAIVKSKKPTLLVESVGPGSGLPGEGKNIDVSDCDFNADEPWRWLGVLSALSTSSPTFSRAADIDSTPFMRLGGSARTDLSAVCHEMSRAAHRGSFTSSGPWPSSSGSGNGGPGLNSSSSGSGTNGSGGKMPLWRAQQKALVEAALEEGIRLVHVPGLEGSVSTGTGPGGSGSGSSGGGSSGSNSTGSGGGGSGAAWPGPAGYSFMCWMRFNPPDPPLAANPGEGAAVGKRGGIAGLGRAGGAAGLEYNGPPEPMQAWGAETGKGATSTPVAAISPLDLQAGENSGTSNAAAGDHDENIDAVAGDLEENGEMSSEKSPVMRSVASPERGITAAPEKMGTAIDGGAGAGVGSVAGASPVLNRSAEHRPSMDSSAERLAEEDESVPRPHLPGRQVLWVFAVASSDGKAFLQLFLDLDLLRFCLRGSAFRGEIRFRTPHHLACGGARVWHHVMLTHARPKSRILGTRDKMCLWVDGELADTVKVDTINFTTAEGSPSAYMGSPHPQAFLETSIGSTVAPLWHMGPCLLLTEVVDVAPLMFAIGPEYTGFWTAESPLDAVSSANATRTLRHLQALGGEAGFASIGGDVPHALLRRRLRELDRCFNVTERAYYWHRADRAGVTDSFYLLLNPEQVTFVYNTRHMERPGGPPAPAAAGAGPPFRVSDMSSKGRGAGGSANSSNAHGDLYFDAADGSRRLSQVPASAKRAATSPSLVTGWLFNVARETSAPSAGPGPMACAYGTGIAVAPSSFPRALAGAGGPAVLFPLLQRAQTEAALCAALRLIGLAVKGGGAASAAYMQTGGGYLVMAGLLRNRRNILGPNTARACFEMAVDRAYDSEHARRLRERAMRADAGGDSTNAERDENQPWGGDDNGRGSAALKVKEEKRRRAVSAWGWERDRAFMPREAVGGIFGSATHSVKFNDHASAGEDGSTGVSGADGAARGEGAVGDEDDGDYLCPFVLLTDPYALKNLVMNHQVWGLEDRELMSTVLQLMNSLVSPHNSKAYCRFNARLLHRIGLFRWGLHFLLEASEPLPGSGSSSTASLGSSATATERSNASSTGGARSFGKKMLSARVVVPIAGFGGLHRPTAVVAAAGLDTRDGFMVSCTLLLQRVLATCSIQRDFDRVVGATLSTLADGGAAAREARGPGRDPSFAGAESVLRRMDMLGKEGSAGDKVLSGQAMVRLYLVRMLLEIVTLPVAMASKGDFPGAEGSYVGGVGSPCARQAQADVEAACFTPPTEILADGGIGGRRDADVKSEGTQLERWICGVPPVIDITPDGLGLSSPLYLGKQRILTVCARALRPDWFISLLETCREEAGVAWTFRLLAAMLQGSEEFALSFQEADGYRAMASSLPRHSSSLPILLSALALALGVPIAALPANGEGMGASNILSILRRNAGIAMGPAGVHGISGSGSGAGSGVGGGSRAGDEPRPFVRVCVAKVLLPALRFNAALVRRAEAAGVGRSRRSSSTEARTPPRGRGRKSRWEEDGSPSPKLSGDKAGDGDGESKSSAAAAAAAAAAATAALGGSNDGSGKSVENSTQGGGSGSSSGSGEPTDASEWRRAKMANEIVSAAFQEALVSDPSFRVTCRSADVAGALVDVLGGTWDEPEPSAGGSGNLGKIELEKREFEEMEVESIRGGDGLPSLSPHQPADLLRLVIADIVAAGGPVVFPSLVRLFNSGAAVMGPTLMRRSSGSKPPTPKLPSTPPHSYTRDISPLGREPGASAGGFQRAMIRHLEGCCREAISIATNASSAGAGERLQHQPQQHRRGISSGNNVLERAIGSLSAVAAAVAEAAAEGLLPGVETGHLAVGFLLSVLRQVTAAVATLWVPSGGRSSPVAGDGAKATALGACHIATVVALRRAIRRESGRRTRSGRGRSSGSESVPTSSKEQRPPLPGHDEPNDLLEECLLMITHNLDTLLGEERRRSASIGGAGGIGGLPSGSPYLASPPPPSGVRSSTSPKPRSPVSFGFAAAGGAGPSRSDGFAENRRQVVPPPLDLGAMGDATSEAPLTSAGVFAETPMGGLPKWSSRFDFPGETDPTSASTEQSRVSMTFSAVELSTIGTSAASTIPAGGGSSAHGTGGVGQNRPPMTSSVLLATPSSTRSPTASTGKSLWESAAAGLVAAADRGTRGVGGNSGGVGGDGLGGVLDGGAHGMRESLVHRLRGSTGRAFVAGFVAELRGLLLSDSDNVRRLATRLAGALLVRRRATVQELLGEELLSTGFSMLEHPLGGEAAFDPVSEDEVLAEDTRAQAFALWLTGGGQEIALKEGFDRARDRACALIPHMSSEDGLSAALTRAELSASGGASGSGGGDGSSTLSRLGSGVGGALGALAAAGPNRKTITVDRAIQRADMIARTFERVATSHGRWVWAGADDLAWASKAWQLKLASLRGKASLWEGGLFGRLTRSPEAIAAARPGSEGGIGGMEEERFKLDMDEGPERARLRLRPNHAFYDTYEVLAPGHSAPTFLQGEALDATPTAHVAITVAGCGLKDEKERHDGAMVVPAAAVVSAVAIPTNAAEREEGKPDEIMAAGAAAAAVPGGVLHEVTFAEGGAVVIPTTVAGVPVVTGSSTLVSSGVSGAFGASLMEGTGAPAPAEGAVGAMTTAEVSVAAAAATAFAGPNDSRDADALPVTVTTSAGGVVDITALVKTMSKKVGAMKGRARQKPLTSVFDLDDSDTSALLELEELRLGDTHEKLETQGTTDGMDAEVRDQRSPSELDTQLALTTSQASSSAAARGVASSSPVGSTDLGAGGVRRGGEDSASGGEAKVVPSIRSRGSGRAFTLSAVDLAVEEDEDIDDGEVSTVTESTNLGLDDVEDIPVELGIDGNDRCRQDDQEHEDSGSAKRRQGEPHEEGDSEPPSTSHATLIEGRQGERQAHEGTRRDDAESGLRPTTAAQDFTGSTLTSPMRSRDPESAAAAAGSAPGASGSSGVGDGTEGASNQSQARKPPTGASAPTKSFATMTSAVTAGVRRSKGAALSSSNTASSGPGAAAREEGWSDRELLLGLLQPEDAPVVAAHDVSRSVAGVEVKRGLLLVCNNTIYCVDGFGRRPRTPRPGTSGVSAGVPPASSGASTGVNGGISIGRSKDSLYGVRRLEEWELGGVAGSIGGGDDHHAEVNSGAKIQVTLRRKSTADVTGSGTISEGREAGKGGSGVSEGGGNGSGGAGSGSSALTAEQAGSTGGGLNSETDEIVSIGHVGVQRIMLDRVHAVYKRRYQLRDVGLEIFDVLGRSVLVSFETQDQQEAVLTFLLARGLPASIFARGKSKLRLAAGSSHAQARAAYKKFMQAERSSWTKKWQLGRCTNFEYLMALNTLAGRSFNDLTQYPVFPWVLCDYVSDELDLDNPGVYRDLSKPMGAIGEARARQFRERYAAVIEAAEETGRDPDPPPFHYGTHYSCAGYILHYLLRLEPFTRLALGLQGGRFDKADRLFRDIRSSWESASSENLQDVRELTPEFFTVPEFLVNSNRFDLGMTQKGQAVNHVVLPPWAKEDPREFIRLHRKALESPHVSRNLHEWVGLIFGCKQRGPEAVEAQNVFVHLTYEGEVDIDSIQDPLLRDAALAQIHNFGQTPSLILKKPHPPREVPPVVRISPADGSRSADPAAVEWHATLTPPLCIVGAPDAVALKPMALTSLGSAWHASAGGGVGDARIVRDKVVGVGLGAILYSRSPDKYLRFGGPSCGLSFFQAALGGSASSSKSAGDRLLSSHASLHMAPVTALACTEDGQLLLTGALDGTCRLWGVVNLQHGGGQVVKTLDLTATLGWHAGPVTCASMSMGSGSAVTGGTGGKVLVWDIRRKTFVRELLGHRSMITSVGINHINGNVISLSGTELRVWTVNGRLLAVCSVTALRRGSMPTCAAPTDCPDWQDGVVAATGHDNGDVLLWGIRWDSLAPQSPQRSRTHRSSAGGRHDVGGKGSVKAGRWSDKKGSPPHADRHGNGRGGSMRVRQLKLLRVLSGAHQRPITFVRVCEGGRELLVGDAKGDISRWQCIRLDQLSTEELNQLV